MSNQEIEFDKLPENSKMHLVLYGALEHYLMIAVKHSRALDFKMAAETLKVSNYISDKIDKIFEQINKEEAENV